MNDTGRFAALGAAVLLLALPAGAYGADLYVSPAGHDASPGTEAKPFKTLTRAQSAARALNGGAVVKLRGGIYELDGPLRLDGRDSGVVYQAYNAGLEPAYRGLLRRSAASADDYVFRRASTR